MRRSKANFQRLLDRMEPLIWESDAPEVDRVVLYNLVRLRGESHLLALPFAVSDRGPTAGLLSIEFIMLHLNDVPNWRDWSDKAVRVLFGSEIQRTGVPRYRWSELIELAFALQITIFDLVLPHPQDKSVDRSAWIEEASRGWVGIPRDQIDRSTLVARGHQMRMRQGTIWNQALRWHPEVEALYAEEAPDSVGPPTKDEQEERARRWSELWDRIEASANLAASKTLSELATVSPRWPAWRSEDDGGHGPFSVDRELGRKILREAGALDDEGGG